MESSGPIVEDGPPQRAADLDVSAEATYMLDLSALDYCLSRLRIMAKEGKLPQSGQETLDKILTCTESDPILPSDVLEVIRDNEAQLMAEYDANISKSRAAVHAFREAMERMVERQNKPCSEGSADGATQGSGSALSVVVFEDERADSEPVHAISIDRFRRLVTVSFRGSVTRRDWKANSLALQKRVLDPLDLNNGRNSSGESSSRHERSPRFNMHSGIHSYLFGKQEEEDGDTKFTVILEQVREILARHPGYQLCTTGHSLGGALCTMFAYWAAASSEEGEQFVNPILSVSFASPKVGNVEFAQKVQALERSRRLQILRVANCSDPVVSLPTTPGMLLLLNTDCCFLIGDVIFAVRKLLKCFNSRTMFRHVGMRLILHDDSCAVSHRQKAERKSGLMGLGDRLGPARVLSCSDHHEQGCFPASCRTGLRAVASRILPGGCVLISCCNRNCHSVHHYFNRLKENAEHLSGITLNGMYELSQLGVDERNEATVAEIDTVVNTTEKFDDATDG